MLQFALADVSASDVQLRTYSEYIAKQIEHILDGQKEVILEIPELIKLRGKTKSGLLAPDIGGKERRYMKKKIKYTDEPMGKVKVVSDFLPTPEELVLKDETVKVTIALSKASVDFFKNEAKKHNTQYQKMIRRLLDEYTARYP